MKNLYLEYIFKTLTKSILTKQTTQLKNWAEDLNKTLYKRYANDKEHRERGASSAPGKCRQRTSMERRLTPTKTLQ